MAVIETVEHTTRMCGGKEYPVVITRRKGLDTYIDRSVTKDGKIYEETIVAEAATFTDWGPKMGTTRCYTTPTNYTEEEREAGRQHIRDVAIQCLYDQGIWT